MLSKKTKYGLKALIYIARQENDNPIPIKQIAEQEKISYKFLESITLTLRKSGFIGSKKGAGGGVYLIKKPKDIRMVDVIRILEGPIALVPCVSLNFYEKCDDCSDEKACAISKLMIQVRDNTLNVLRKNTLADLM